jgi:Ran GTPase-activating protein (RanGAP) involved in mRNA processing and transport
MFAWAGPDLTGLETVLLSDNSKITELDINLRWDGEDTCNVMCLTRVLQALVQRPTLTKLGLRYCALGHDAVRLLRIVLCNTPSLQTLDLEGIISGSAKLTLLAPALYRNTSIKELDMSRSIFESKEIDMESASLLRDILRSNETITTLDLSGNAFTRAAGAVDCIADASLFILAVSAMMGSLP